MVKKHTACWIFTRAFPGEDDEVFLQQELPIIANNYKQVIVFPLEQPKNSGAKNEDGFSAVVLTDIGFGRLRSMFFRHFLLIVKLFAEEFKTHRLKLLKRAKPLFFQLLSDAYLADRFLAYYKENKPENVVLYAYWFDRWANILAIARYYSKDIQFIARAHAFDLYEEDNVDGYIPFRKFQLRQVSKVFTVSKHGGNYLKNKYSKYTDKIASSYLGCPASGLNASESRMNNNTMILISCGSVQPRKRITEIPYIIKQIQIPVRWVHFGDGPHMALLKEEIQKLDIAGQVELKGHVSNREFRSFLFENTADAVFLSISRNEGLPYTLMEAISHGIPVFSTDAMGCRELVTNQTGQLFPLQVGCEQVARQIEEFYHGKFRDKAFRSEILGFWKKNFNADTNYNQFHQQLMLSYAS